MDFRIAKLEFLRGLRLAQSIADRKSTMPMLANVLLRTMGKSKLLIAATDLNVSVTAELEANITAEGGLTVSAKSLHDIVSSAPGDEIALRRAENNWAELKSGKVSFRVVGMPDRDFPKIPDARELTPSEIDAATLREMIDRTLFSVCNDETRFHLNGVLFESSGDKARMVSTDGHRLSKVERALVGGPQLTAGVIIPKKGLLELKRVLEGATTVKIAVRTPYLFVVNDDVTLAVKLIDAQFPPYEMVIPKEHKKTLVIDRHRLIDALKRAQLMSSDTRGVKLSAEGTNLTITSDNPDLGEVREELDAEYGGAAVSIGFNPKYVIELLSQMASDQVGLHLGGELDPGLFKPLTGDDYLGVVMPMRSSALRIEHLSLDGVRNLARVELAPGARFHVFAGDNGQGKTNLLETIFVVAALRSFRTARLADLIGFGRDQARIAARVERGGTRRLYELVIEPHGRRVRLDDKAPRPLARYFGDFNVVLFAPEDLALPRGTPGERRRFLDRAVFNRQASYLATVQDYDKVVRSRNRVLDQLADGRGGGDLLAVYDDQAATLGGAVIAARLAYLDELRGRFLAAFEAISRSGLEVDLAYESSLDEVAAVRDPADLAARMRAGLAASRARDLARRATSVGPHRDDLRFAFRQRDAGAFASQGQLRALILAWKTAELALLGEVHGELPILLLDDVSSELDEARNRYLFEHLAGLAGQCFITTTHARHVLVADNRADYTVRGGEILPVESAG